MTFKMMSQSHRACPEVQEGGRNPKNLMVDHSCFLLKGEHLVYVPRFQTQSHSNESGLLIVFPGKYLSYQS